MGLETASYVGGLVASNPTATDAKSQGDDHLRLIKAALLNSFAGFTGMVVVTGTEAQGATASDYTLTLSPSPSAYTSPMLAVFKATHANTGAATVQIGALGTKPLVAVDGTALKSGDIESGGLVAVFYDGTSFYLMSGNDRADRNGETYSGTHDFTGATPKVPTKAAGDNSTNAASTAYVDGSFAPLASPALTGTPTAPTATAGTNTTQIATTAFVVQMAFAAALPAQPGGSNVYQLQSVGGVASWQKRAPLYVNASGAVTATENMVDTSAGAITLTLPAAPGQGDTYLFHDASGTFDTNNLTIARNGNTIMGSATDLTVGWPGIEFRLWWNGSDWRLQ